MIKVTVVKRRGEYRSFVSEGHAGFSQMGTDIVCAAVSVLTINTVNSIDAFTEDIIHVANDEGYLSWEFINPVTPRAKLLMDSLVLGLKQIQDNYGKKYLRMTIKEV